MTLVTLCPMYPESKYYSAYFIIFHESFSDNINTKNIFKSIVKRPHYSQTFVNFIT